MREGRLVAYVVPELAGGADRVADWKELHELLYASATDEGGTLDDPFAGWNSTYDGTPIPRTDMRVWRDTTVDRIRALAPQRILEIGVGSGLLLTELAPELHALPRFRPLRAGGGRAAARVAADPALAGKVVLDTRPAHEVGDIDGSFDTIVVNSVIQYFPSAEYLLDVLRAAARLLAPGGTLFVGDVRHAGLLRTFRAGVLAARSESPTRRDLDAAVAWEGELLCAPELFTGIDGLGSVEVLLKRGTAHDELTRYRYDVVLRAAAPAAVVEPVEHAWPVDLGALLADGPDAVRVTGIPNARLTADLSAQAELDGEPEPEPGEDPEELARTAEAAGYAVTPTWSVAGALQESHFHATESGVKVAFDWRRPGPWTC